MSACVRVERSVPTHQCLLHFHTALYSDFHKPRCVAVGIDAQDGRSKGQVVSRVDRKRYEKPAVERVLGQQ